MPSDDENAVFSLMNSIANSSGEISKQITSLLQRVKDGGIDTSKGISFLEVKYHQLLAYLINVTYVMCMKSKGTSINRDPAIDRLVEIRTVLERMRPIEHKLRYQIEKVVKAAASTSADGADPLQYKPNPEDLVSKLDDDEDEDGEEDSEAGEGDDDGEDSSAAATKLYRPPKLAAAHYDEDDMDLELKAKKASQKRAFGKSMMEELRREYYEGPEEVHDTFDHQHRAKEDKHEKETTEYEEKYFVRMPVSKKQKHAAQKVRTLASLDDLVSFGGSHERDSGSKANKQKRKGKHFKKGGQKKRRKFH